MSAPLVPSPLDYIGSRRFAFHPPIKNAGPNTWVLGAGSWSEVQVINAETGREIWVPRQHVGAVGDAGYSLLTVGLRKALDLHSGVLEPRVKRVIEFPRWSEDQPPCAGSSPRERSMHLTPRTTLAPVVAIRLSEKSSTCTKAVFTVAIGAMLAALLAGLIGAAARLL